MHSSVAPGFSRLSQELIDEIVDYYFILNDGNDYKEHEIAIKACPLISRAFRDRSQKLLFTKLFFVMDDESQAGLERLKRLNDVFSTNPRLASHVRVLTLRVKDSSDLQWNPCFENRNFMECMGHMSQSGIGQQPPHLEICLSAKRPRFQHGVAPITNRIPRSRALETHFIPFVASRLTSMVICNLRDVPVALFDTSHNLVELHIDGITLAPFDNSKRTPMEKRSLIRELWVKNGGDVVCNCLRFDKLFKVTFCNYDVMTVRGVLSSPPPSSLEYLYFDSEDDNFGWNVEIDGNRYSEIGAELSALPNLSEMHLYVMFPHDIDESRMDVVTSLAHFLRTCPARHQLKDMHLSFEIVLILTNADAVPQAMERIFKSGNWAVLDSVLVAMTKSITDVFKVDIHIAFWLSIELDEPLDPVVQEIKAEHRKSLCGWGQKYLPRISASDSPNLELKISTQNDIHLIDGYNYPADHVAFINT